MDKLTRQLFARFPREIGLFRNTIHTIKQFENYITYNSGVENIYTSIYPNNFIINKIFIDNDFGIDVLGDTKKIFKTCLDMGLQTIPIASGNECRMHLYPIVYPEIHGAKAKIRLLRAHYSIIEKTFGKFRQEPTTLPNGKQVQIFRNNERIISPDPAVCGDVRRLARIVGALRPNGNYCTYIDPDEFLDMTELDIINHIKEPHTYDIEIDFRNAPRLQDFDYDFESQPNFNTNTWTPLEEENTTNIHIQNKYLKTLMRPCIYRNLAVLHPTNKIRYIATIDLLYIGLTPENITSIYSSLGWEDFDAQLTFSRVEWIESKMKSNPEIYHITPCSSLAYKGIAKHGECPCRWNEL